MTDVLMLLDGGHSTLLKGISLTELEDDLVEARHNNLELIYLQDENHADNGFCVDPKKVVALTLVRT